MQIPTPTEIPDIPGFTGQKIADDTVAITDRDPHGVHAPIVKLVDDGNACFLQLANIEGHVFSRPIYRTASGQPYLIDAHGAEVNGPNVGAS